MAPVSIGRPRSATVLSDPSTDSVRSGSDESDHGLDAIEVGEGGQNNLQDIEAKDWEDELYEAVGVPISETHDWETLHAQIQHDLKRKHQDLSLLQINKLMILSNFVTFRIKGASRIAASLEIANKWNQGAGSGIWFAQCVRALARHYQIFEQLSTKKQGGSANSLSLFHSESVQNHACRWLSNLETGQVTPRALQNALNNTIFPNLGITPRQPICERTTRHWLIKLGWRKTVIQKGVYMDGHEHADVVKYHQEVFLPAMQEYERRMVHFDGSNLL